MIGDEFDAEDYDGGPSYRDSKDIEAHELIGALHGLQLFGGDSTLSMQSWNLAVVDQFIMQLEDEMRASALADDGEPRANLLFASAQTQMWIFAAYEMLRTWRSRAKDTIKLADNSGLPLKIASLRRDIGYRHHAREARAEQLQALVADPSLIDLIRADLRRTHFAFIRLEFLRVSLAKHEVSGKKNSVSYSPGYGRIDRETGSLNYELETGDAILGTLSRRDVADELRALADRSYAPSDADLADFDAFMKGSRGNPFDEA